MKFFTKSFLLLALLSLALFSPVVRAEEDEIDELEDEDVIGQNLNEENVDAQTAAETEADEETAEEKVTSSPYAKTNILFVNPVNFDLPAGKLAKLLVGFHNNGSQDFVVESLEGSLLYPQDFSYHIQNFSRYSYNKAVTPESEATFEYLFTPSETFSSRQFGFTLNLKYRNADGKEFFTAVFNETISVVEPDEGLDGETFFLYIFLAAIIVLCGFASYQFLSVFGKKKSRSVKSYSQSSQKLSNGNTSNTDDVDYEWIPKSHLQPNKLSPKQSPRNRKPKNGAALSSGNSSNDEQ